MLLIIAFSSGFAQSPDFYADIHTQSTQKAFNSRTIENYSVWERIEHDCGGSFQAEIVKKYRDVPKYSQANLEALAKGDVRVVWVSISPIEGGMLKFKSLDLVEEGQQTLSCVSGIKASKELIIKQEREYFDDLVSHLRYLKDLENQPFNIGGETFYFTILRTGTQVNEIKSRDNVIAIIPTIEGGHSLGNSIYIDNRITSDPEYEQILLNNIERLKGEKPLVQGYRETLDFPILSVAPAGVFWNGLCGQAETLDEELVELYSHIEGTNKSVTAQGAKVIESLLSIKNGHRILVDVANMNVDSRKWYYEFIKMKRSSGDTIPIICSHAGVSGKNWNDDIYGMRNPRNKKYASYLSHGNANLSREDIQNIVASEGIIGLSLNRNVLIGNKVDAEIENTIPGSVQERKLFVKCLAANIFTIINTAKTAGAWDMIAIGSDFDGGIVPFNTYQTSQDFPALARDLEAFFQSPTDIFDLFTRDEVNSLMYDFTAKELMSKLMAENAINFVEKNLGKTETGRLVKNRN